MEAGWHREAMAESIKRFDYDRASLLLLMLGHGPMAPPTTIRDNIARLALEVLRSFEEDRQGAAGTWGAFRVEVSPRRVRIAMEILGLDCENPGL